MADGGQAAISFTPDPDGIYLHIFESFKLVVLYVALYVCMYSACYIPDTTYEEGTINLPFLLMRQLIYRDVNSLQIMSGYRTEQKYFSQYVCLQILVLTFTSYMSWESYLTLF